MERRKNAIYPLSADPMHNGHMYTLRCAVESDFFDKIYFAIGVNPMKKTLFTPEERVDLAKRVVAAENLTDKVKVIHFEGLLRNYAKINGIDFAVRGYRNAKDAEYEAELADFNGEYGLKTWLVPASKKSPAVSSSIVKAVVSEFGLVHEYVHPAVKQALEERMRSVSLVGVTGSMGAGKSTFCKKLVEYAKTRNMMEVSHLDFDKLVHSVYYGNSPLNYQVNEQLKKSFGDNIFNDAELNRKKLAGIVFGDYKKRNELARIVLAPSLVMFEEELRKRKGIVLVDAAYFTEYNMLPIVNYNIIFVDCDEEERYRRIQKRDAMNRNEVIAKTKAQQDPETKKKLIKEQQNSKKHGFFYEADSQKVNYKEAYDKLQAYFPLLRQEVKK